MKSIKEIDLFTKKIVIPKTTVCSKTQKPTTCSRSKKSEDNEIQAKKRKKNKKVLIVLIRQAEVVPMNVQSTEK